MKKIAVTLLLCITIFSEAKANYCGVACWHNPEQQWPEYTHSCYESEESAIAAFNAECPGQVIRQLGYECWKAKYGDGQYPKHFWYPGPNFLECCPSAQHLDNDGDGITNICDPHPDQAITFDWKVFAQYENSDVIVFKIRAPDGTEKFVSTGGDPPAGVGIILPNANWMDSTKWSTMVCGPTAPNNEKEQAENPLKKPVQKAEAPDTPTETPEEAPPGETDPERIAREDRNQQKIVDNTAAIASAIDANRKRVGDVHTAILQGNEKLSDIESQLKKQSDNLTQAETEKESQLTNLDSQIESNPYIGEITDDDVPELDDTVQSVIEDFIENNPVTAALQQSGLQATGDCTMTWDYNGRQIEFSACAYQDVLQMWGNLVLGMAALLSILIITRR